MESYEDPSMFVFTLALLFYPQKISCPTIHYWHTPLLLYGVSTVLTICGTALLITASGFPV